jgi:hypothetical protein
MGTADPRGGSAIRFLPYDYAIVLQRPFEIAAARLEYPRA